MPNWAAVEPTFINLNIHGNTTFLAVYLNIILIIEATEVKNQHYFSPIIQLNGCRVKPTNSIITG